MVFLHFYSPTSLKLVLCIFCLFVCIMICSGEVYVYVVMHSLYFRTISLEELFKVLCSSRTANLQAFARGRQFLLQGKKSVSLCCKPSWIRCHCTLQAYAQISMPTHMLSFSAGSLRAVIVV